jgi:hypothetical protein
VNYDYIVIGDLMEIYLYGNKQTPFYSPLYLSKFLSNNNMSNISIEEFGENVIKFSNDSIDKNAKIIISLKETELRKIFLGIISKAIQFYNYKFRGRYNNGNNSIYNFQYYKDPEHCPLIRQRKRQNNNYFIFY